MMGLSETRMPGSSTTNSKGFTYHWSGMTNGHWLLFHVDSENKKGGGVVLYVRDTLQCCLHSIIKTDSKTESLWGI